MTSLGAQKVWHKTWRYVKLYRCQECNGPAEIHDGVVTVVHSLRCQMFVSLAERHPRLLQTVGR